MLDFPDWRCNGIYLRQSLASLKNQKCRHPIALLRKAKDLSELVVSISQSRSPLILRTCFVPLLNNLSEIFLTIWVSLTQYIDDGFASLIPSTLFYSSIIDPYSFLCTVSAGITKIKFIIPLIKTMLFGMLLEYSHSSSWNDRIYP